MNKTAIVTISSRNYFAQAFTLLKSVRKTNPLADCFFALADDEDEDIVNKLRSIESEVLSLEELEISDLIDMEFRYNVIEFNTAIKPFVLRKLLKKYERVIYIDPDIFVYSEMSDVYKAFDEGYDVILTPHLTGYFDEDGRIPGEKDIMQVGVYNLGFLGITNSPSSIQLIDWWADKLKKGCVDKRKDGIFVDQKWMDLVPGRHTKVYIIRNEGYNVAPWNLNHRKIRRENNEIFVNNDRLVFFHFSSFDPHNLKSICKNQNRYRMKDLGTVEPLYLEYAKAVIDNDYDLWRKKPYAYASFDDKTKIINIFRIIYRDYFQDLDFDKIENPFECGKVFNTKETMAPFIIDNMVETHSEVGHLLLNYDEKAFKYWVKFIFKNEYGFDDEWTQYLVEYISQNSYKKKTAKRYLFNERYIALLGKKYPKLLEIYRDIFRRSP